jgi:inorganic triphosphatase YgiF
MREEVIATVPQNNGETALEMALVADGAGSTHFELRHLVWGDGLGWYRQHTLTLDAMAARALLCSLGSVRHRLKSKALTHGNGKIIPFRRGASRPEAQAQ